MHTYPRPLRELVPASPEPLDRLIRECIAKDPEERIQSAGDVRRRLNGIARGDDTAATAAASPARASMARTIIVAVVAALAASLAGFFAGHRGQNTHTPDRYAFTIPAPPGCRFRFTIEEDGTRLAPPAISPDGRQVVFGLVDANGERACAPLDGRLRCASHSRVDRRAHRLLVSRWPHARLLFRRKASQGVDRQWFAGDAGGWNRNPRGATWNRKGTILYAPTANRVCSRCPKTADSGAGNIPDTTSLDISHRWPLFPPRRQALHLPWCDQQRHRARFHGGLYPRTLDHAR